MKKSQNRIVCFASLFSLLFTLMMIIGENIDKHETIWTEYDFLEILGVIIPSYIGAFFFFSFLPNIENFINQIKPVKFIENLFFNNSKKSFWICFLFITICNIPAFLAYFPGIFTYDVYFQSNFYINKDYIEFHPLLHTWLVYLTLLFSQKFNTPYWGVFVYTIIQVTCMNLIFAYAVKILSKYKIPFILKLCALLFFSIYPTNQVFPLIATKDVLFCGFVLLFVCLLLECILDKEVFIKSKYKYWGLIASVTLMFLFKHNGFYAYIIILPVLFFLLFNKIPNYKKSIVCMLFLPIFLYCGFSIYKNIKGYKPVPIASSLGIPLQQMGRVIFLHTNTLPIEDKEIFEKIVSPVVAEKYKPFTSDVLLKDEDILHCNYVNNSIKEDSQRFINLYLKWFHLYPKEYIDAPLINHYTYWFFPANYNSFDLHYYLYTENRWDNYWGTKIEMHPINEDLRTFYNSLYLDTMWQSYWYLKAIFSIPLNTWYIITAFFILLYRRKYKLIIPVIIIPAIFLTVLFGPTTLLRYVYQNFLVIPMLLAFCFGSIEENNKMETENNNQLESAS